jgi:hypothetical protein
VIANKVAEGLIKHPDFIRRHFSMKNYAVSYFARFIPMGVLAVIMGCASTPSSKFYRAGA